MNKKIKRAKYTGYDIKEKYSPEEKLSIEIYEKLWRGLGVQTLWPYGYGRWITIDNYAIYKIIQKSVKKYYQSPTNE